MSERLRVPLGELLRTADEPCVVQEDGQYPNFGIYSFGRGLFRKPPINGISTSARTLFRVRAGNFIYSRLFAFEGAYGMVGDEFDGFFVSNEYPSFEVDCSRILPAFLAAYFRLPSVWKVVGKGSKGVGSRRIRIHPDKVLAHQVALPPIDEQQAIVARLDSLADKTRKLTTHLDAIEADADQLLAQSFQQAIAGASYRSMSQVAPLVRREVVIDPDTSYTELGVRSFYKGTFHRRTVAGSEFTWQKMFWIEADDLIFSNIMAWEQAIALARSEDHGCVGNHRMLACLADRQQALPAFLAYYFTTEEGFAKVYAASPGTAARNRTLVAGNLEAIEVPVPPLATQQAFVDLQATISALKTRHAAIRADNAALLPSVLERIFVQ